MFQLKNGVTTEDPRLDRIPEFDEESKEYPVSAVLQAARARSYHWRCDITLDQGREGACVGFAWTHEAAARPVVVPGLTNAHAQKTYKAAQLLDEWPGEAYSGTSVLAGAKVMQAAGYFAEYRWAFNFNDLLLSLGNRGPAVLGIDWYDSMYEPQNGWLELSGRKVGGHAILAWGVSYPGKYVSLHNSWGADWGRNGNAKISFYNLEKLLADGGEACIPSLRKKVLV